MKVRLTALSERDCYDRCYGPGDGNVRIVKVEPRRRRYDTTISGEELRRRFEDRLTRREAQP